MAVVIASNLRKELAGSLLFDGVSFSVERRDRVALSGPNGAGKTTLLRILAGQTEKHGGELAFEKDTRIALHDQRPPLERALSLREYVLSGAQDLIAVEQELRSLEEAMAGGVHDQATLNRYASAQARLEHAGGYGWRDRAASVLRGLGFADGDLDRPLRTFSGGELTRASLARALGGDPDLLLLDEPTNHLDVASLEWLERELQTVDAAVILVAHDRWFLEAVTTATLELSAGPRDVLPGAVARVAAREGGARAARAEGGRARRGGHRAARALRRALPREEGQGEAGAGEAHAHRPAAARARAGRRRDRAPHAALAHARLRVPASRAQRAHRRRGRGARPDDRRPHASPRQRASRSSAASTSRSSGRTAPARRRCSRRSSPSAARGSGTASRSATSRSRRWSSTRAAPCSSASRR